MAAAPGRNVETSSGLRFSFFCRAVDVVFRFHRRVTREIDLKDFSFPFFLTNICFYL